MNITLDIENYRGKREDALRSLARRMSSKVLKYRRSVTLEPMLPYERRIIHSEVQNIEGVSTNSIGVENNRRVVIYLEEVGFEESMAKDRTRASRQSASRGERRESPERPKASERQDKRGGSGSKKKSITDVIDKIEKTIPHMNEKETEEDGDFDYSSTAYLREPTKRFSSFAEYESHMANLASNAANKDSGKAAEEETEE